MATIARLFLAVATLLPAAALAKDSLVRPGHSIQAAVDGAAPGDRVLVLPGTYREAGRPCPSRPTSSCAVVVSTDDVSLIGLSRPGHPVVLAPTGEQDRGVEFAKPGADGATCFDDPAQRIVGSRIQGFTVQDFQDDGIFLFCADDWAVLGCRAHRNLEYGIFPSHCGTGVVRGNVATGSNDTGIYIGQSFDVLIDHNVASDNVSGFEIENSSRVRLAYNFAFGNTAGILSFTLPFLDVKTNRDNRIDHNLVKANNRPNTCLDPDDAVCALPPGTGILLVAADRNEVDHNAVLGNRSFGIGTISTCLTQPEVCLLLDIDPFSDENRHHDNVSLGNGRDPDPGVPPPLNRDLVWDGTGAGNCWSRNAFQTAFPEELPACEVAP
jgi:parallel beta-helix repeat protein